MPTLSRNASNVSLYGRFGAADMLTICCPRRDMSRVQPVSILRVPERSKYHGQTADYQKVFQVIKMCKKSTLPMPS
jgi:hypothetical protein